MYLANGDLHECEFVDGRAEGDGQYCSASGMEMRGKWSQNKRVGMFTIVDGSGVHWKEKYNADGKRVGRKKVREKVPNPDYVEGGEAPETIEVEVPKDEPAVKCWNCNNKSRDRTNHAWSCRAHKGRFTEDRTYTGSGERPGVWSCCGRQTRSEPGCTFQPHCYMAAEGGAAKAAAAVS